MPVGRDALLLPVCAIGRAQMSGACGAALRLAAEHRPNLLVLDLVMPGLELVAFVRRVRDGYPETAVLVLTAHDRDGYLARMMEAGAVGFLSKEEAGERIVGAVRRAAAGEVLFTPWQVVRACRWWEEVGERWESLTEREREVLRLMAEGLDNKDIAGTLGIQVRTVEQHITHILHKLGLSSRLEAVVWVRDRLAEELWESPA